MKCYQECQFEMKEHRIFSCIRSVGSEVTYCISEGAGARNVCAQCLAFNEAEIFQPADGLNVCATYRLCVTLNTCHALAHND